MFKGHKNKEKHQNYDVNFLYFAVSPFATCDGFLQITSHMIISIYIYDQTGVESGNVIPETDKRVLTYENIYCFFFVLNGED